MEEIVMNRRLSLFASLAIFLGVVFSPTLTHAKDIVVGTSVALTGKHARTGQEQLQGFQMWVEEVNALGVGVVFEEESGKASTDSFRARINAKPKDGAVVPRAAFGPVPTTFMRQAK